MANSSPKSSSLPLVPASDWGKFALGYALLWLLLIAGADAGWGKFTSALALLIAGGATVLYGPKAITNIGLGGGSVAS